MSKVKQTLKESPFKKNSQVFVVAGQGAYRNTQNALANLELEVARGKRVLLKPNAGRIAESGSGIVTDPEVVDAAITAFQAIGAEVAIGESPISGVKALEALAACGISKVAEKHGCEIIDLDERKPQKTAVPAGLAINQLQVCAAVYDFDIIVSIPVMKMHMHTGVSLSIKNMKGCLWKRSKVTLHMLPPVTGRSEKSIDIAIADLAGVLKPHLAIIDGTVGMEGLGPSAGQAKELGAVVVAVDPFAADAVACELMGISAQDIPHLREAAARGYGEIELEKITVTPSDWRKWSKTFRKPPENLEIEFPGINILDKNSCSACQSTLLLFLKRYGEQIFAYFPQSTPINIAIGKGHEDLPEGTLCLGNCTAKHKDRGIFIPGCPPVVSEILGTISGKPAIDTVDGKSTD